MKKHLFLSLIACLLTPSLAETPTPSQQLASLSIPSEQTLLQSRDNAQAFTQYDFRLDIHQPDLFLQSLAQTPWGQALKIADLFPRMGVKSIHLISTPQHGHLSSMEYLQYYIPFPLMAFQFPSYMLVIGNRDLDTPYTRFTSLWQEKRFEHIETSYSELEIAPILLQIRLEKNAPILSYYKTLITQLGEPLQQEGTMSTWNLSAARDHFPAAWRDAEGKPKSLYLTLSLKDDCISALLSSQQQDGMTMLPAVEEKLAAQPQPHELDKAHILSIQTRATAEQQQGSPSARFAKEALQQLSKSDAAHAAEYLAALHYLEKAERQLDAFFPSITGNTQIDAWYDGDIELRYSVELTATSQPQKQPRSGKIIINDSIIDQADTLAFAELCAWNTPQISLSIQDVEAGERAFMDLGNGLDEQDLKERLSGYARVLDLARALSYSGGIYASHDYDSVAGYLGLADKSSLLKAVGSYYKPQAKEGDGERFDQLGAKPIILNDETLIIGNNVTLIKQLQTASQADSANFIGLRGGVLFNKPTQLTPFSSMKWEGLHGLFVTAQPVGDKIQGRVKLVLERKK